jgi:hypothetical protein
VYRCVNHAFKMDNLFKAFDSRRPEHCNIFHDIWGFFTVWEAGGEIFLMLNRHVMHMSSFEAFPPLMEYADTSK